MECSAFLCPKRKIAQAVTLTVAEAFRVAQEEWEETELNEQHKKQMVGFGQSKAVFVILQAPITKDVLENLRQISHMTVY